MRITLSIIMDVEYTEGDRLIELNAPEDFYYIVLFYGTMRAL